MIHKTDPVEPQYNPYKDHITAQTNRINQYLTLNQPTVPWFNANKTVAAINSYKAANKIKNFNDAIRKFGFQLSQAIVYREHEKIKKLLSIGGIR